MPVLAIPATSSSTLSSPNAVRDLPSIKDIPPKRESDGIGTQDLAVGAARAMFAWLRSDSAFLCATAQQVITGARRPPGRLTRPRATQSRHLPLLTRT